MESTPLITENAPLIRSKGSASRKDLPNTKTFQELLTLLKNHICPRPSEVAKQHKFCSRVQHEGESISQFVAELKRLSTNCNFVCINCNKSTFNTHLRLQFIRGIRDNEIRERLLQSSNLSFEEALKVAHSIESAKS